MKTSQNNLQPKRRNVLSELKGSAEAKITHAALILEYAFEHGVDLKNRVINIVGEIDEKTFLKVDAAMTLLESENKSTIVVRINSPGGEVYQALAIIGRIRSSKCHVVTEGYGCIMSAATIVLACGDKRRISKYSFYMHHEASYELQGKHSEIVNEVKQAEKEEECWAQWMSELTSQTKEFWKETGKNVNAYMTSKDLIQYGVADEEF